MNNLPDGAELLQIARETLLSELRPLLGENARYTVAMIANAMAIAARETEAGEAPAREALARLNALYDETASDLSGAKLSEALANSERRLARDIRSGRFDEEDEKHRAMLDHLRQSVAERLWVSNPKSLPHPNPSPGRRRAASEGTPLPAGEGQG